MEHLCNGLRSLVEKVRSHEREIMELCTKNANMPRAHFIKVFPGNETNLKWANEEVLSGKAYVNVHSSFAPGGEIRGFLQRVPDSSTTSALLGASLVGLAVLRRRLSV